MTQYYQLPNPQVADTSHDRTLVVIFALAALSMRRINNLSIMLSYLTIIHWTCCWFHVWQETFF